MTTLQRVSACFGETEENTDCDSLTVEPLLATLINGKPFEKSQLLRNCVALMPVACKKDVIVTKKEFQTNLLEFFVKIV